MIRRVLLVVCLPCSLAACARQSADTTRIDPTGQQQAAEPRMKDDDVIGVATMESDGTIVLRLRAAGPDGVVGDGTLVYPPSHERYHYVLDHVGGLSPGEEKRVRPFPDEPLDAGPGRGLGIEPEKIVIPTNAQGEVGDVRMGAASFWERDYMDDRGVPQRGLTALLMVFVRRPDLPEGQTEERIIVWPGKTFQAGEERFRVDSLEDEAVTLVRLPRSD